MTNKLQQECAGLKKQEYNQLKLTNENKGDEELEKIIQDLKDKIKRQNEDHRVNINQQRERFEKLEDEHTKLKERLDKKEDDDSQQHSLSSLEYSNGNDHNCHINEESVSSQDSSNDDIANNNAEPQTDDGPWILDEFEIAKACRFNVETNKWVPRARNTKLKFYQDGGSGHIRIECSDSKNELRISHLPDKERGRLEKKQGFTEKDVSWIGVDKTDHPLGTDHAYRFYARFKDVENADAFMQLFECAAESNEQLK
mmetsp:Transcript_28657/g.25315  ORF Transcript_28657/g.25315 Transcript_28657/m.25315 type:complete len:256 (+) Transcript_28657:215-982(+)